MPDDVYCFSCRHGGPAIPIPAVVIPEPEPDPSFRAALRAVWPGAWMLGTMVAGIGFFIWGAATGNQITSLWGAVLFLFAETSPKRRGTQ